MLFVVVVCMFVCLFRVQQRELGMRGGTTSDTKTNKSFSAGKKSPLLACVFHGLLIVLNDLFVLCAFGVCVYCVTVCVVCVECGALVCASTQIALSLCLYPAGVIGGLNAVSLAFMRCVGVRGLV